MKLPISKLRNNTGQIEGLPANPRQIDKTDYDRLLKSLKEDPDFLTHKPLHVYEHNDKYVVLGGNQRLRALKELGYKEVPVTVYEPETPVEVLKRRIIIDNSTFGDYDMEMLGNEWSDEPLTDWGVDLPEDWLEQEPEIEEDEAPEVSDGPPVSKLGEVYQLGRHRVMCGDSTDKEYVAKLMNKNLADLVVTDPPYNVDYKGGNGLTIRNDKMDNNSFLQFLLSSFGIMREFMRDGGSYYVWHADLEGYNFRHALKEVGLPNRQVIHWVKSSITLGRQDYQSIHESALYGWKDGSAHYFVDERYHRTVYEDKPDIKNMKKDELLDIVKKMWSGEYPKTTVVHEDKPRRSEEHPTMKPIKLLARHIQNSTKLEQLVLDIFLGSGSTLIACEQTDRTCYGMELDPKYVDVVRRRYHKFVTGSEEGWEEATPRIGV